MNNGFLDGLTGDMTRKEIAWQMTRDYFASLPPAVEDAAYRAAVVHWFNVDILGALLGTESLPHLQSALQSATPPDVRTLYEQVQQLLFVEVYPDHGYNFHDLTREAILDYLWHEQRDYYRQVSDRAAEYFFTRFESNEAIDWSDLAEWLYHLLIVDEEEALDEAEAVLDQLAAQADMAPRHALVQVLEEHANAGRLSPENVIWIRFWRLQTAYYGSNYAYVREHAGTFIDAGADDEVLPEMRAEVTYYLAQSARDTGRYAEAYDRFYQAIRIFEQLQWSERAVRALMGLANVCFLRDEYDQAEGFLYQALYTYVPMLILPSSFEDELVQEEPALDTYDRERLVRAQLHEPNVWFRLGDFYPTDDVPDEEEGDVTEWDEDDWDTWDDEPAPASLIVYGIIVTPPEDDASADDEPPDLLLVEPTGVLAEIWLRLAELYRVLNEYALAADCSQLAGQMFIDLDDAYGFQSSLQVLHDVALALADPELVAESIEMQQELLTAAREQGDRWLELEALLSLASSHASKADYVSARDYYEAARDVAADMDAAASEAVAVQGIAELESTAGQYEAAAGHYDEALALYRQIDHRQGEALLLLSRGDFELARDRPESADRFYAAAADKFSELEVPSGYIDALRGRGRVARYRDRYEQALDYFNAALTTAQDLNIPSQEATLQSDLAYTYSRKGDTETAHTLYHRGLELVRNVGNRIAEAGVLVSLGEIAVQRDELDEATDLYQQAHDIYTQLDDRDGELETILGLSDVYQQRKELDTAIDHARTALSMAREMEARDQEIRALLTLAESLRRAEQYEELFAVLDEGLTIQSDNQWLLLRWADTLNDIAAFERALDVLERAEQLESPSSDVFAAEGWALENLYRAGEARDAYERALKLNSFEVWTHKGLGNALRLLGDMEAATAKYRWVIEQANERDPTDVDMQDLMGWCHYAIGEYDAAIRYFRNVLDAYPDRVSARFDLALSLLCSGQYHEALDVYQRGLDDLEQKHVLRRRGLLYIAIDDLREAIAAVPELQSVDVTQEVLRRLQDAYDALVETTSSYDVYLP